jgi:hypothetical protein
MLTAPIGEELFPCLKARGCSPKRSPENGPLQRTARRRGWAITLDKRLTFGDRTEKRNTLGPGSDGRGENDLLKLAPVFSDLSRNSRLVQFEHGTDYSPLGNFEGSSYVAPWTASRFKELSDRQTFCLPLGK